MSAQDTRTERDSMGALQVPNDALWGAQTQRAVENFQISGQPMPAGFIAALGLIKAAAAQVNAELELLDADRAKVIRSAAERVANNELDDHFPVDVFQTGSGTSSNMNANEVIARIASENGVEVHPNDHVNMGQSSNDVVPTALHLATARALDVHLEPAISSLIEATRAKADALHGVVKTGRTHLMDAMPLRFDQELGGWAAQLESVAGQLAQAKQQVCALALGGTAVGTGINAHPAFGGRVAAKLAEQTGLPLREAADHFAAQAGLDAVVAVHAACKGLAVVLMKIANDLRWMNSGPLAGLGEIELPALQPGSSIMPGKVNPVVPEAVCQVAAQVMGNDVTLGVAAQSGNFQLNVMLPLAANTVLQSIRLLANACGSLGEDAIAGFTVRQDNIDAALARNPVLVTALNARIGYEQGAKIAKQAYAQQRPVLDVAEELTDIPRDELEALLDPGKLTQPE
ncbi:class II fumarate hydratase [bacterium]|nr:class II fumarate hydratase [bacterium]